MPALAKRAAAGGTDIINQLGFGVDKLHRKNRLLALSDPVKYEKQRNAKMDAIEKGIEASYTAAVAAYTAMGYASIDAESQAQADVASLASIQMTTINNEYPPLSGATMSANQPAWAAGMDPFKAKAPRAKPKKKGKK
jgi:hypothetical protein